MTTSGGLDALTLLGDGIVQMRLPMMGNPLGYVNGYLLEDDDGYTLVDCGWRADDVLAALESALAAQGLRVVDIRRLAITHAHFDHYGLAGTLRRMGVRDLAMHPADFAFARDHLANPTAVDAAADAWIARNGLRVDELLDDAIKHNRTELTEPTHAIEDGERLGRLRAVWTPGHTPGHLCFVDERTGKMLTGDHVLDPITPHVGVWRPGAGDPLGAYVGSLRKVRAIGASYVLPAHREPFGDLERRVDELLAHHEEREARVIAALRNGPANAAAVAGALPWTRRDRRLDELEPLHRQFAVAETIAHLEHLRARGVVVRDESGEPIVYASVSNV